RGELVFLREGARTALDALEDAVGGGDHALDATLARLHQGLLAGGEGVVDLLTLGGEIRQEGFLIAEATVELLELKEQAGELGLAAFGRVGLGQRAGDGLLKELELRDELGLAFLGPQAL